MLTLQIDSSMLGTMLGTSDIPEPLFSGLTANYEEDISPILRDIFQELVSSLRQSNLLNITLTPYKTLGHLTSQKPFVKTVRNFQEIFSNCTACK
jgi:hypothetical protein